MAFIAVETLLTLFRRWLSPLLPVFQPQTWTSTRHQEARLPLPRHRPLLTAQAKIVTRKTKKALAAAAAVAVVAVMVTSAAADQVLVIGHVAEMRIAIAVTAAAPARAIGIMMLSAIGDETTTAIATGDPVGALLRATATAAGTMVTATGTAAAAGARRPGTATVSASAARACGRAQPQSWTCCIAS